jgi:hypothetical protein
VPGTRSVSNWTRANLAQGESGPRQSKRVFSILQMALVVPTEKRERDSPTALPPANQRSKKDPKSGEVCKVAFFGQPPSLPPALALQAAAQVLQDHGVYSCLLGARGLRAGHPLWRAVLAQPIRGQRFSVVTGIRLTSFFKPV